MCSSMMKVFMFLCCCLVAITATKKKELSEKEMFGPKSLSCCVCKAMVEEFDHMINSIDSKKMTTRNLKINKPGTLSKEVEKIPNARSPGQLEDMIENICAEFENYAQAKTKDTGDPTVIRIVTHSGSMNPLFTSVDIVPDDDLNTRLKYYCETILENQEENILEIFSAKKYDEKSELCFKRSKICEEVPKEEL